jgi:hypothetical protein
MDTVQIILIIVIIALTLLLTIVGFQVVLMIIDLRKALKRLNSLLEDSMIGGGLIRTEKISGIMELFKKNKKLEGKGSEIGDNNNL